MEARELFNLDPINCVSKRFVSVFWYSARISKRYNRDISINNRQD